MRYGTQKIQLDGTQRNNSLMRYEIQKIKLRYEMQEINNSIRYDTQEIKSLMR